VTSRRPTLRWSLPGGATGAHINLCRDRALTTGCVGFDAVGASGAPGSDLAAGVWYWALNLRTGSMTGTSSSPTWQFTVRVLPTLPTDTSWGTTLDVNGDDSLRLYM
jgi:hypothetical protein